MCWIRWLFIGFQNVITCTSSSARSIGLSGWCRVSNVYTCSTNYITIIVFKFRITPFFPLPSPFLSLRWLAEFLLRHCVNRYLAINLILNGYAVIFPWEYARRISFLVLLFFEFIRKVLPFLGHFFSLCMWVVRQRVADNIQPSLLPVLPLLVIPSLWLFHLRTSWSLPLRHHTWSWPLLWNHWDHTVCCYYNCLSTSLLQLACKFQTISLHRHFCKRCVHVWGIWWDSLLDYLHCKFLQK